MQGLVKAMETAGREPGTIRLTYTVAARLFASAVDDRKIPVSPCRKVTLPRTDEIEVHPPTVDQVTAAAKAVGEPYRALVVTLAGTGVRIAEALALRVTDVDFLRRTLRVERQRARGGGIAPPKTAKSARTVPLAQVVVDELAAHLAHRETSSEWLFTDEGGRPLGYARWSRVWRAAKTGLRTHDLRHFTASALIAGGASVKLVQTMLGHSSAVVTLKTYAHMWPGDDERTRAVIDANLNILRTPGGRSDQENGVIAGQDR